MFETLAGNRSGTLCLSKAGLAEGTNAATIKTAAPNGAGIDYAIEGILYHKADGDNVAMTVSLIAPIAMEEGLRFAIREGGRTVGAGVVSKIIE